MKQGRPISSHFPCVRAIRADQGILRKVALNRQLSGARNKIFKCHTVKTDVVRMTLVDTVILFGWRSRVRVRVFLTSVCRQTQHRHRLSPTHIIDNLNPTRQYGQTSDRSLHF